MVLKMVSQLPWQMDWKLVERMVVQMAWPVAVQRVV
jgi:hypothetical protein